MSQALPQEKVSGNNQRGGRHTEDDTNADRS